jgi:hypothetical protein
MGGRAREVEEEDGGTLKKFYTILVSTGRPFFYAKTSIVTTSGSLQRNQLF